MEYDISGMDVAGEVRELGISLIETARGVTAEALAIQGGSWRAEVPIVYTAVLVEHPKGRILFDSGLGTLAAEQVAADIPWYLRGSLGFTNLSPVIAQVSPLSLDAIYISHTHWDHISAVRELPRVPLYTSAIEHDWLAQGDSPALPSQLDPSLQWASVSFNGPAFLSFPASYDVFGDGRVLMLPMYGHTPGSMGMYVHLPSGKEVLFVGDVAWSARAIEAGVGKGRVSQRLLDDDRDETLASVREVQAAKLLNPNLVIVPAHDPAPQAGLAHYPAWER